MDNKFTFVIPVYNEEDSIIQTLESICNAVGKMGESVEIIISTGNSYDNTAKISEGFLSDKNIPCKILKAEKKKYPGAARNAGIENSSYANIILIDCGITIDSSFMDECVSNADDYEILWFESGFHFTNRTDPAYVRPYFKHEIKGRYIRHCMIRRNVLKELGCFREDIRAAEDWLFYKKVKKAGVNEKFSSVQGTYSGYPENANSFFRKWNTYFEHSVYAGIYKRNIIISTIQFLFILLSTIIMSLVLDSAALSLLSASIIYMIARSVLNFVRSKIPPKGFIDTVYTVLTSTLLEISRVTGVATGLYKIAKTKKSS